MKKAAKKSKRKAGLSVPRSHYNMLKGAKKKYLLPTFRELNSFGKTITYTLPLTYPVTKDDKTTYKKIVCDIKLSRVKDQPGFFFKAVPRGNMDVGGIDYPESYGLENILCLSNPKRRKKYIVTKKSVSDFEWGFEKKKRTLTGRFLNFRSQNITNDFKSFWRLVVPISEVAESDVMIPAGVIDHKTNHMVFDNSRWDLQQTLLGIPMPTTQGMFVQVTIQGNIFEFYTVPDVKALLIDSINELTFKEFKNVATIIRTAFGFIRGKYYRDEAYYVSSKDIDFKRIQGFAYQIEMPTIISDREILNHQLFFQDFRTKEKEYQEENKKYHRLMQVEEFSALCQKMYENETYHRSIDLMLSAMSNESPIVQGALYSVALETLTNLIKEENPKLKKVVITNKDLAKTIKEGLLNVLTVHKDTLNKEAIENGYEILTQKINQINEAPNSKKLSIPFDIYKIKLEKEDIEAVKNRNIYLHGNSPLDSKEKFQLELISLRLHTLIGSLILKNIGYEGHIINLPVWHHFSHREQLIAFLKKLHVEMTTHIEEFNNATAQNDLTKADQAFKSLRATMQKGAEMANAIKII